MKAAMGDVDTFWGVEIQRFGRVFLVVLRASVESFWFFCRFLF